ncbi:integral membrane protein [Streptomyces hygroscopicus subsp. jinggangensis 5008]|nr:integral membrane protein [Streptomyces hygroscopicus subsp. jinggangensis 5008]AGF67260.1 integral membrane protein [Streptomyces hygroscopicus subsp. jinggangensis TL01]
MSALALSVLLSVVSALAYAGGAIVQEQVAVSSPDSGYLPLRRPGWWGALALNGLGAVLHVVALAYGPLSLVQPLGALTIVFALPLAALCVGRRAGATAWRGALMATVGLAGLLSLVGSSSAHSLTPAQRLAVALVTGGAVVALMFAGLAAHRHPAVRSVLLATASGIAFGMSSVFTKTVAVDWSHGIALGDLPSLAVIVLFSVAGVLLSQASYRGGGLAAPLATLTVVNPVLAAAVGILMFGETFRYGTTGTVLALGCGVVAAGGLIMLTTERLTREPAPAPTAAPTAAWDEHALASAAAWDEPVSAVPAPAVRSSAEVPSAQGVPVAEEPTRTAEPAAPGAGDARLAMPHQRKDVGAGAERGGRAESGAGAAGPTARAGTAEAVVRAKPIEATPRAGPIEATLHAGPAEPVGHGGPVERAVRAAAAESVVSGLLVSGPAGSGGADADGAGPIGDAVLPPSYTPLPAGVTVPLPLLDRHPCPRQILTPPARR